MNYSLLFPFPAKRLLEEQLSNYIRRHLEGKKKATCSLHTKCGRVDAGSPSPRPLELLGATHRLLPALFVRHSHISLPPGRHQLLFYE